MDYASLTDSQQLYQQYQQHQLQQQHQSQTQPYDPSQSQPQPQSYDQSYYNYYQQQYQPYYQQPDYYHHHQQQNDSAPIQPPGVSAPEPVNQPYQHNAYYPTEQQQQQPSSYPVPSGLNPAAAAAVAALSQLTQFAGTMDAAERAMAGMHDRQWPGKYAPMPMQMDMPPYMAPPPHAGCGYHHGPYPGQRGGRAPHRGGGRRGGGGPSRGGGGRGNFGHRPPRTDGSNSQFHGRGRGRGGNRRQRGVSSHPETVPSGELASEQADVGTSTMMQGETPLTATIPPAGTAQGKVGPPGKASSTRRQPQIAWCELCRVDCTSLDILEQHKNGKKHKKNMQRLEELLKAGNAVPMTAPAAPGPVPTPASTPMLGTDNTTNSAAPDPTPSSDPAVSLSTMPQPEVQNQHESLSESKSDETEHAENVEGGVTNNTEAPVNLSAEVNDDTGKVEPGQQNDIVVHPEVKGGEPSEAPGKKRKYERFDTRKRGMNKKMRGGRGAKRVRTFDRPTRSVEPSKPKEVVPILCDLCNVKCDTAAVFETHLAGKKHMSKLKRFQGHQAMFGPVGLQALYPPNPNTQPIFIPQVHHQTMYAPQGHFHQPVAYVPHAQGATVSGSQTEQNHGTHVTWDGSQNDMPLEFKGPGAVVGQGQPVVGYMPEGDVAGSEEKAVNIHSDTSAPPPSENTATVLENVSSAKDEAITATGNGSTASQNTTFPGSDNKVDNTTITNEGSA